MKRTTRRRGLVAGLGLTLGALAGAAQADHETHSYGVADFGGAGECSGSSHPVHEDTAHEFDDAFDDLQSSGIWDTSHVRLNSSVRGSYFEDASKEATADDDRANYGADEADVIFIHTHGGHKANATDGYYSYLKMGNSSYDCSAHTHGDMYWDLDLDIAIVKACQSGDYKVWENGGYRPEYVDRDGQMRMWNAFHGNSSCGNHVKRYVRRYAGNVTYDAVGEEWIDQAYDRDLGANNDDCPTSIVFGDSSSKRDSMYEYGGWRDRKSMGTRSGSSIYYISECDPSAGIELP